MANWYDIYLNKFNFYRWADGEGRLLSDIQVPELYCLGTQSTATTQAYATEVYENKNNFYRWIDGNGMSLSELADYFCKMQDSVAYSDGYSEGYS